MTVAGDPGGVPLAPEVEPDAVTFDPAVGELTVNLGKVSRSADDRSDPWEALTFEINPAFPLRLLTIENKPE